MFLLSEEGEHRDKRAVHSLKFHFSSSQCSFLLCCFACFRDLGKPIAQVIQASPGWKTQRTQPVEVAAFVSEELLVQEGIDVRILEENSKKSFISLSISFLY